MENFQISTLDIIIIIGYFTIVFLIGLIVARRTKEGDDLFLAGRSLAWGAIGFSLFASNISSTTLIGLSGQAYATGISVSNYEWITTLLLVFMAIYFIPFYIKSRISTIPEFLEKRFNAACRKYFSVITIFLSIMVDTAGGLFAGAIVLKVFIPDLVIWQTCLVLAVFAGLYTAAGGLAAVVYTDVLQAVVLIVGTSILSYIVFSRFDFSWEQATAAIPEGNLSVIRPLDDPALPWLGTLIGAPVLGFYYWCTNQYIVQRVLGARNLQHARWGAMLGGLLKLPVLFIMVLPGAFALSIFPELENPDLVFPTMVANLLPTGITGLVLAGLVAAIMSSIDSALNSGSTLVVLDFIKPKRPDLSEKDTVKYGRIATLTFMTIAAVVAPLIAYAGGLFKYIQEAFSYIVPPVVAIFIVGLFWARGNGKGALRTLIVGHSVSAVIFLLTKLEFITLHYTIVAGLNTIFCAFLFYAFSMASAPPPEEKVKGLTWQHRPIGASTATALPWYKDYRVHSAVLVVLTVLLVITFW